MPDFPVIIPLLIAVVNAALALFIILGKKDLGTRVYAVFVLFLAAWSLGIGLFLLWSGNRDAILVANFYYFTGSAHIVCFLIFTKLFPLRRWDGAHCTLATLPLLGLGLALMLDEHFIVRDIVSRAEVLLQQPVYTYFTLMVLVYIGWAFSSLFTSLRLPLSESERGQMRFITIGTTIAYSLGIIPVIIMPWFGDYRYIWIGPIASLIMVAAIGYAVTRHQLFNVKVIATELLTFFLWFFLLARTITSANEFDTIMNGFVLLLTTIFGILLIRSVRQEVKTRERVELLAQELSVANAKLEALNKQKSEFVSIASHQLRTPLTAIKGYSSMLLEGSFGELGDKAKEAVDRVFQSSERLVAIVEDFLNLSRIELGRMHYEFSSIDLKKMVREVTEELTQSAKEKGLNFIVNIPEGEAWMIWADGGKVRQVLSNIIDNAIKYTLVGNVSVKLEKVQGVYRFSSIDTGIGLSKNDTEKLFEKYKRTDAAKKAVAGGSGLGLFIAQQIMKAHRSSITVSSRGRGRGTTFGIDFAFDSGNHATMTEETKASILSTDADGMPSETVAGIPA